MYSLMVRSSQRASWPSSRHKRSKPLTRRHISSLEIQKFGPLLSLIAINQCTYACRYRCSQMGGMFAAHSRIFSTQELFQMFAMLAMLSSASKKRISIS